MSEFCEESRRKPDVRSPGIPASSLRAIISCAKPSGTDQRARRRHGCSKICPPRDPPKAINFNRDLSAAVERASGAEWRACCGQLSLTVRYVLSLHQGPQLRFASLLVAQKAVIRGIGTVSGEGMLGGGSEYYFSRGRFFVRGRTLPGLPTSSFISMARRSLLARARARARIRLTACALGICHPRFLCSGAKQTRNAPSTLAGKSCVLATPVPPVDSNAPRSRYF